MRFKIGDGSASGVTRYIAEKDVVFYLRRGEISTTDSPARKRALILIEDIVDDVR